jgi:RimJ/RimL family protein N-acetyltransferase
VSFPRLETERLLLREWNESDIDPYAKMNCDPEVKKYFPKNLSYNESKAIIQKSNSILNEKKFGLWAKDFSGP